MSDAERPKLIYVTSRGHSGSTLTEMLLAGHSQIVALGELKQLGTDRQEECRCGAGPIEDCTFWQSVDAALRKEGPVGLAALSLEDDDDAIFEAHNEALFRAVSQVTGASILIDSSKSMRRLTRLEATGCFDIRVLHLLRSPFGVVYSNVKRGRAWREHARNYTVALMKTRDYLGDRPVIELRYEALAARPRRELERVLAELGLSLEETQLDWANQELHTFAGNPMRVTRDSTIRPDTEWRRGLGWRAILGTAWWTLPVWSGWEGLYRDHVPYWKGEGSEAWRAFRRKRKKRIRHQRRLRLKRSRVWGPLYAAARTAYRTVRGRPQNDRDAAG